MLSLLGKEMHIMFAMEMFRGTKNTFYYRFEEDVRIYNWISEMLLDPFDIAVDNIKNELGI